jgi:hypothetical protein
MLLALLAQVFVTEARVPVAGKPAIVAIADLNGDGKGDLIVLTEGGAALIFLGDGKGRFGPAALFPAGHQPNGLAVADLNGDGKPDLIIANHEEKHVTVLLGNGRGGFTPAPPLAADVTPHVHNLAAADLDGDGKLDVVLNDFAGKRVVVLWGGGGTSAFKVNAAYYNVVAADVNGDGIPDVVVPAWPRGEVSVLLGDGKGGFKSAPGSPYAAGRATTRLAAGDMNGDGIADLAVGGADSVALFLGGKSGLRPARSIAVAPHGLALGDLDGDGKADLAVGLDDEVRIYLTR